MVILFLIAGAIVAATGFLSMRVLLARPATEATHPKRHMFAVFGGTAACLIGTSVFLTGIEMSVQLLAKQLHG